MIIFSGNTGLKYFDFKKHLLNNLFFPNVYFSILKPFLKLPVNLIRRNKND